MIELIKSKDVREYIEKTGFKFSDADLATIVYQSGLPIPKIHEKLCEIHKRTQDTVLKQQIEERITYDELCLNKISANDGACFYKLIEWKGIEFFYLDDSLGYFSSLELAMEYAKHLGTAFVIEKYQIIGLCGNIIVPPDEFNTHLKTKEKKYKGESISSLTFNLDGKICSYWTCEVPQREIDKIENWGKTSFEHRFVFIPNPFDRGDIVREIGTDRIGVVDTSKEEWNAFLQRVREENLNLSFCDMELSVGFFDENGKIDRYAPVHPMWLEKIEG